MSKTNETRRTRRGHWVAVAAIGLACTAGGAMASEGTRQSLSDSWWTGPMIANSPAIMPVGHAYVESYAYDVRKPGMNAFGSQTFMLYGLTDKVTVGVIPSFGYTRLGGGASSSRIGVGDVSLHAQYGLTTFDAKSGRPAMAVAIEESLPVGKFDNLDRASDGFGSGTHTTTLAFYAQDIFWMPNGRILRSRINLSQAFSAPVDVSGLSVYGTQAGFHGKARPGSGFTFDNSWEYSLSRHWGVAVDFLYRHDGRTEVTGADGSGPVHLTSHASDTFAVAPAVEYNWNANLGVLFGLRVIPTTATTKASLTPVVALSVFM